MLHTLCNAQFTVQIDDFGAELASTKGNGCEYVWQGDEKHWDGHAPILFPICGRLYEGKYTYRGTDYNMTLHGFAWTSQFEVKSKTDTKLVLVLRSDENTRATYPFEFELEVTYVLEGNVLRSDVVITNKDEKVMPATFGAHPGFSTPLSEGVPFESYYLQFGKVCTPNQLVLSDSCLLTGLCEALPLDEGCKLHLNHEMFARDGIFMNHIPDSVTLKSDSDPRSVTVTFPDFPYLGIWQSYDNDTPFLCIEPWCGLPAYEGRVDDLEKKHDMFHLRPGETKEFTYSIMFN